MSDITFISRPGCHLCDDARALLLAVQKERGFWMEELSIDDHPALADKYKDHIPVVLLDGQLIAYWTLSRPQLIKALESGPDGISVPEL